MIEIRLRRRPLWGRLLRLPGSYRLWRRLGMPRGAAAGMALGSLRRHR